MQRCVPRNVLLVPARSGGGDGKRCIVDGVVPSQQMMKSASADLKPYRAMRMNLAPQEQPTLLTSSSKRWTRSAEAAATIDGRECDDLKWGFTQKRSPVHAAGTAPTLLPFDRRASWLVHLPARQSSLSSFRRHSYLSDGTASGDHFGSQDNDDLGDAQFMFSPGQVKFDELMAALHEKEIENQRRKEAENMNAAHLQNSSAVLFCQWYEQRYGSSGTIEPGDESPPEEETQSPGGVSESEFWRLARHMHDAASPNAVDCSPLQKMTWISGDKVPGVE